MNNTKSVQWFSFLNPSQNRWAMNLLQEDQSFNHLLLVSITIESETDRSTDLLCKSKNQPTNTWMDKRCSFYAVNNNYKIIISYKLAFCYKDIVYSVILSFNHLLLFLSHECMIEGLNRCLFCMLVSIHVQQTTRQITIAVTMKFGYANGHQYRWLIIWKWKWMWKQCLEQKGNEMKSSNDNKMWINGDMSFVSNHWNANSKQYPISKNTIFVYN